jgi:glycosyltransferase involved in cell wall biosynthesis
MHIQKRLDRAIRAAAVLRAQGQADRFRFLMVGDGPDEGRLRALVRELALEPIVEFVGRVEPNRVRDYYAAADVALLTTARLEGLPMTVLEALACGLPCIVPTGSVGTPALSKVLIEVDPTAPELIADTLRSAVRAPHARTSLLPPEFTLEHCAQAYLEDFRHLAEAAR